MEELLLMKCIQFGFAGFCVILLSFIFWLVRQLLTLLKENNKIVSENTAAIKSLIKNSETQLEMQIAIKDRLLSRPCIAAGENK